MASKTCSCKFKEQMIAEMLTMRKHSPNKTTDWVDMLFSPTADANDQSPCCLLAMLFYYGYCKECSVSMSEHARALLSPLMAMDNESMS